MLKKTYPYYLANQAGRGQHRPRSPRQVHRQARHARRARRCRDGAQGDRRRAQGARGDGRVPAGRAPRRARALRARASASASEELALALCIEAGKPIKDARGEVTRLIDTFRIAAGEATRIDGEVLELEISPRTRGYRGMVKRVPIGACAFITPFNFPLNLVAHKVAPAIAAGCPFVLKPAAKTPIGALIIGEVLAETDLPKGAFSILPCCNEDAGAAGRGRAHRAAQLHRRPGRLGAEGARGHARRSTLELGGNAACIVDEDPGADLDDVVERLVFGAYYQSGQSCISVQRIYVHADDLRQAAQEAARPRSRSCAWAIRRTRRPSSAR